VRTSNSKTFPLCEVAAITFDNDADHATPEIQPLTASPKVMALVEDSWRVSHNLTMPFGWPDTTMRSKLSMHEFTCNVQVLIKQKNKLSKRKDTRTLDTHAKKQFTLEVLNVFKQSCFSTSQILIE
jgi:hypothetical protein